jgi:hypothetical protein
LVAEEVAKVNPDLVMMDEQGKPFTVRYDEVNAMLLNEFLKEHRRSKSRQHGSAIWKQLWRNCGWRSKNKWRLSEK